MAAGATRRIVYVADTSCYGATGSLRSPRTNRSALRVGTLPRAGLDRLDGYIAAGLPIVTAFPGWVYGNDRGSATASIEPVMAGRRVLQFGKTGPWVSPIHVDDCARALVHLAERGEVGGRYFLVNTDPVRMRRVRRNVRAAREPSVAPLAHAPGRKPAPRRSCSVRSRESRRRVLEHQAARHRLPFQYPTLERGLQQVLGALHE